MPWKPVDPYSAERERQRRRAMELVRPKNHNRAYKRAAWAALRLKKLVANPVCEQWSNRPPSCRSRSRAATGRRPALLTLKRWRNTAAASPAATIASCARAGRGAVAS